MASSGHAPYKLPKQKAARSLGATLIMQQWRSHISMQIGSSVPDSFNFPERDY